MDTIQEIRERYGTLDDKCRELADVLGLAEPVTHAVLHAALYDSTYAHNLLASRRSPAFLHDLLSNPPKVAHLEQQVDEKASVELVKKATEALWKWAKTGFSTVEKAVLEKRYNTCMSCPHLKDQPNRILYKVVSANKEEEKVCSLCGCVVANKVRLPSEACPDRHPVLAGMNRWEEPISAP